MADARRLLNDPTNWNGSDAERLIQSQRATLDGLERKIKEEFPAEAGAIFLPMGDSFISYSISPNSGNPEPIVLEANSFLGSSLSESYGIPMRFHTPSTLNDADHNFETNGLDLILERMGLNRPGLTGAVDFRLKLDPGNSEEYIPGIIINPLNPSKGVVTREAVRFNESDPERVAKFLDETQRKLYEIHAAKDQGERDVLAKMFAVPHGYINSPAIDGWDALSFMGQLDHPFGGDIIDGYLCGEDEAEYTLGDIVHHGLKTAQLNYDIRQRQRNFREDGIHDLGDQLSKINSVARRAVIDNVDFGMSMYMILRSRNSDTGRRGIINYAAAGCELLIIRSNGRIEGLTGDLPVGLADETYKTHRKILSPGDLIFMGTDGYEEAQDADRNMYRKDRIKKVLKTNRREPLRTIYEALEDEVATFTANGRVASHYTDDRSGTLIRFNGFK